MVEGPKIMMRMWMLPNKGEEHDSGVVILYGTIDQPDKKGKPRDAEKTTVGRLLLYGSIRCEAQGYTSSGRFGKSLFMYRDN